MSDLIEDYNLDTIQKRRYTFDEWNNKVEDESARATINCRVFKSRKIITDEKGNDVMMSAIVTMASDIDIEFNDEIQVDNKWFTVKRVDRGRSFSDNDHIEVLI